MSKFKITKGSEKDFEGAPDWAVAVSRGCDRTLYWEEDSRSITGNRWQQISGYRGGKYDICSELPFIEIIAQREPIAEPVPDADGWIKWEGGECPVERGTLVDVRYRDGEEKYNLPALTFVRGIDASKSYWIKGFNGLREYAKDIVAYRLRKPEVAEAPVWNGEGLPPVGVEFEFGSHRTAAKCLGIGREMIFASKGDPDDEDSGFEEFMISILDSEFHPIRSPEEIERQKAIAEMLIMTSVNEIMASKLYDAGYRKVK